MHLFLIYLLILPAVITQIINPIGIPTKEAKVEIEEHPVTVKIIISQLSI